MIRDLAYKVSLSLPFLLDLRDRMAEPRKENGFCRPVARRRLLFVSAAFGVHGDLTHVRREYDDGMKYRNQEECTYCNGESARDR